MPHIVQAKPLVNGLSRQPPRGGSNGLRVRLQGLIHRRPTGTKPTVGLRGSVEPPLDRPDLRGQALEQFRGWACVRSGIHKGLMLA